MRAILLVLNGCFHADIPELAFKAREFYSSSCPRRSQFVTRAITAALMAFGSSSQTRTTLVKSGCSCTMDAKLNAKSGSAESLSVVFVSVCEFGSSDFESEGWRFESSRDLEDLCGLADDYWKSHNREIEE